MLGNRRGKHHRTDLHPLNHVLKVHSTSAESDVFIDFEKKAFDRVWHAAIRATMRKYNINAILVCAIEHLYDNAISAVLMNGSTSEWVRAPVGVTELQKKEIRRGRMLPNISYKDHITYEVVHRKIQAATGKYDELLTLVKKRKLR